MAATLQLTISTSAFIVMSKTDNTAEKAFAVYQMTNGLAALFANLITIWKKENILKTMEGFEAFTEKSEFEYFFFNFINSL